MFENRLGYYLEKFFNQGQGIGYLKHSQYNILTGDLYQNLTSYNLEDFEHSFKGNRDDYMGITFSPDMGIAVMGYKNKRMLGLLSCDIDQQSVYKKIEYDEFKKLKNFAYAYKSIEIPRNGRVPLKNGVSIFTDIVRTDFFSGDKYYTTIHTPDNKEYHINEDLLGKFQFFIPHTNQCLDFEKFLSFYHKLCCFWTDTT